MEALKLAVLSYISQQKWAMAPDYIGLICSAAYLKYCGDEKSKEVAEGIVASLSRDDSDDNRDIRVVKGKNIQVIPISGVIRKKNSWMLEYFGGTSTEKLMSSINAFLESSDIDGVVMKADSPGGTVDGVKEAADLIFHAQQVKPIVTYVDGLMASAGLYLGSPARKITAYNTAEIGSIGVWTMHSDWSKLFEDAGIVNTIIRSAAFKATPNPYEPLTKEIRAYVESTIGGFHDIFTADVARYMNTDIGKVQSEWATGKLFLADKAKSMGLIDEIMTLDETIEMVADMAGGKVSIQALSLNKTTKAKAEGENLEAAKQKKEENSMTDEEKKEMEGKFNALGTRLESVEKANKILQESNEQHVKANKQLTESNTQITAEHDKLKLKMTLAEEKSRKAQETKIADSIMGVILADSSIPVRAHGQIQKLYGDYSKHIGDDGTFMEGSESAKAFGEQFAKEVKAIEADFSSDISIGVGDPKNDANNPSTESDKSLAQELARSVGGKIRSDK